MRGWYSFYFSQESTKKIFWTQDERIENLEGLAGIFLALTVVCSFLLTAIWAIVQTVATLETVERAENKPSQHLC